MSGGHCLTLIPSVFFFKCCAANVHASIVSSALSVTVSAHKFASSLISVSQETLCLMWMRLRKVIIKAQYLKPSHVGFVFHEQSCMWDTEVFSFAVHAHTSRMTRIGVCCCCFCLLLLCYVQPLACMSLCDILHVVGGGSSTTERWQRWCCRVCVWWEVCGSQSSQLFFFLLLCTNLICALTRCILTA